MLQLKQGEYVGLIYDLYSEQVIETSPIIRGTPDAAYRDALELVAVVNTEAEAADDESDGNTTIGRVDDSYCYVQDADGVMWDYPVVNAEPRAAREDMYA